MLKRGVAIILSAVILLCAISCTPQQTEETNKFEAAVTLICEALSVERDDAVSILETLNSLGLDEEIDEIYPATDGDGNKFYKIWFGLNLLSVYLEDNKVSTVYKHGEIIYPKASGPDLDDSETNKDPDENIQQTELHAELVSLTSPIKAGQTAAIEISADPNTKYSITVRYSSGPSSAKGLEPKVSDENGKVSWSWKVSSNVKPGEYSIEISAGNALYKTTFKVEEPENE